MKGDFIYPFYASFKLTSRCQFRCKFCDEWRKEEYELPKEKVFKVLDNLADSSVLLVSFEGGEPLLREDIEEILRYAASKPFYLLFTTSQKNLLGYPMERYCDYIDFLHISIDEGHSNLELFDQLELFSDWDSVLCVQIVVTREDLSTLESKVARCHHAGAKALIMPAVHLNGTKNYFPNFGGFKKAYASLKSKYKETVITPEGYFKSMEKPHGCSALSVIIDSDGGLFYPCKVLGRKPINLIDTPLLDFVVSNKAGEYRRQMRSCLRRCGWYQYFAITSFTSFPEVVSSLRPYL